MVRPAVGSRCLKVKGVGSCGTCPHEARRRCDSLVTSSVTHWRGEVSVARSEHGLGGGLAKFFERARAASRGGPEAQLCILVVGASHYRILTVLLTDIVRHEVRWKEIVQLWSLS